jgi:hypothetical protein
MSVKLNIIQAFLLEKGIETKIVEFSESTRTAQEAADV